MKLSELLEISGVQYNGEIRNDVEITNVETSSSLEGKDVAESLFVCICGSRFDTHGEILRLSARGVKCFIVEKKKRIVYRRRDVNIIAVDNTRKALALIARAFYGFPDRELFKVGITGTKGKTTITYMLRSIFENASKKCGIIGSNGIIYDDVTVECENSTPGPLEYYRALRSMADNDVEYVFCEVTSQALKQFRTAGTVFDIAVFTNLYPDHIGENEHKDFEEYREFKGKLFENCKYAILNDDSSKALFFKKICDENNVDYALFSTEKANADFYCSNVLVTDTYSEFFVYGEPYRISLPGKFNVTNALCAIAVSEKCGINASDIREALSFVRVYGRCERVENPCGVNIIIDYAHTGESLENILSALKETCRGRLYCVFGAGGNRSKLRRTGMGRAASEYADFSIVTCDNPRFENPDEIISDIVSGMTDAADRYTVIPDRKEAIFTALSMAKSGDTVLLAGKGGQTYEERDGLKVRFDEREVVCEYYNVKKTQLINKK